MAVATESVATDLGVNARATLLGMFVFLHNAMDQFACGIISYSCE